MIRIDCPLCGTRDHIEFAYGGDATKTRPAHDVSELAAWVDYVFPRDNPRGRHSEYWHHAYGCRQWLVVERDTVTHEIFAVRLARDEDGAT